ncbi:MAG: homoserine O-acetyltransferase [Actinobacteria bacterium]|nr:homoserine O-acetyltransferase [Actinomycetota bacterium]NBO07332.1 homoserine O-acetyltransferase [Actinomycetota bacterium]NBP12247.1 homoserine O-acetyltransferase [Actinomycetota bacterium]NBP22447.1 homoserine O-acetyltransferase [Actinomycetota bacterium]NBY50325.1 homoserine O-acetyltransferase [Actinomycetota bacterium]
MEITHATSGAWFEFHDPGFRRFQKIGNLQLESGETLPDVTIAYQTWGELNSDKSNAILINHALTGWSDVSAWWPQMVGAGLPFDSDKYFIICPNVIGGCQGSTGPSSLAPDGKRWGSRFPYLSIRDMVAAEVELSRQLGIDKYLLAVGPSLGGMRSLEWVIAHPERVGAICTIGSSAVATADQIGAASIQIQAIKADPNFNGGDYYEQENGPIQGMAIARKIAHLTYRSEYEMDMRFGRDMQGDDTGRFAVESYLDHQGRKLQLRFDANTYICLTEAMNSHDIGRDRGGVAAALSGAQRPVVVVSIDTDRLFPVRLQEEIVELTPTALPLRQISSPFGHDGFLIEVERVGQIIRESLELTLSK